jgi:iron complex transport system permease protein
MAAVLAYSTFTGAVSIPFDQVARILANKIFGLGDISDIRPATVAIVWELYAPRGLMGLVAGAGLALVGVVMQSMVQNPLADPYILGVSSGASLGATFSILMGATVLSGTALAGVGLEAFAFAGAIAASAAVFALSSVGGRSGAVKLILSGMVVASVCGALSNFIIYLAPSSSGIRGLTFWLMGSLSVTGFASVALCGSVLLICLIFFATQARNLDSMMLGDDVATTLGVSLSSLRMVYMGLTSLMVAVLVCSCGLIGFVGLFIPHIGRALVGSSHWRLLPVSVLLGAIFMMGADIAARSFTASDIPIGIIAAICGTPVFAYIMIKKSYGFGAESR